MDIKRFSNFDKLASFVGLVPSRVWNPVIPSMTLALLSEKAKYRPLLIEAAWVAAAADPESTMKFNQLCKTISGQKAILRLAKKHLSRGCLKNGNLICPLNQVVYRLFYFK